MDHCSQLEVPSKHEDVNEMWTLSKKVCTGTYYPPRSFHITIRFKSYTTFKTKAFTLVPLDMLSLMNSANNKLPVRL